MKVKVINLTKKFFTLRRRVTALNDVSFEVEDREIFVLLGPSGCGKSTLLNLIAGLEKPTKGEIWFNDKLIASAEKKLFVPPKERNVGMVFQSYALYPHLNVFENIAFPLKISGLKKNEIKKVVEEIASLLNISDLLYAKPAELSGGQRQRVAIARAVVRKPELLLLDEPLSNLDAQLRLHTRTELKKLIRKLNITAIYVTHDQTEAMSLGDRVAVLREGRIEQIGKPIELYEHPKNTFIATFIGSPPMNLLKTSFIEEKGEIYIFLGNKKFKLEEAKAKELKKFKSREIILGIRPEHILVNPSQSKTLKAKIISIESFGKEQILQVEVDKYKLFVLSHQKEFKEKEIINIGFNFEKVCFFEREK